MLTELTRKSFAVLEVLVSEALYLKVIDHVAGPFGFWMTVLWAAWDDEVFWGSVSGWPVGAAPQGAKVNAPRVDTAKVNVAERLGPDPGRGDVRSEDLEGTGSES